MRRYDQKLVLDDVQYCNSTAIQFQNCFTPLIMQPQEVGLKIIRSFQLLESI